jgi:hypothetical protein
MRHPPPANGPWRVLILDPYRADPKWVLATVASPRHVRPASSTARDVDDAIAAWVIATSGLHHLTLIALPSALCWRLDERP